MLTANGQASQPQSVRQRTENGAVNKDTFDVNKVLAQNLRALMGSKRGPTSQPTLKVKSKVSQATIGRILRLETSATTETIAALATAYGLEAWQLLVAGMDPKNPPVLQSVSAAEKALYERLKEAAVGIAAMAPSEYKAERK
jgi:transcriptional regulator with XRE-family HTH domain